MRQFLAEPGVQSPNPGARNPVQRKVLSGSAPARGPEVRSAGRNAVPCKFLEREEPRCDTAKLLLKVAGRAADAVETMSTLATVTARPGWTWRIAPRPLVCAAIAVALAALAVAIVFVFRIGPVIAVLDAQGGHGIHSGDLWAFPTAAASALFGLLGVPPRQR